MEDIEGSIVEALAFAIRWSARLSAVLVGGGVVVLVILALRWAATVAMGP